MLKEFAEVYRYRELLLNLMIRDLKVRYKNSVLGFFWSLANPLLQVAVITLVIRRYMGLDIENYSAYLLCAFLPWTFFQMSILDAAQSVLFHGNLVKKTYFPREILPISIVLSNLVHFILALVIFFIYLQVLGTPILVTWLLLPVLVVIQLFFTLGVAFFVSCLNVFYEDIKYMANVVLSLLFFLMPIMYLVEQIHSYAAEIPEAYQSWFIQLYYVNPLSLLMTAYRKFLLPPLNTSMIQDVPLNYWYVVLAGVISLVIFIAGYAFFNRRKWSFAERV